jgi:hypothetical protein
MAAIAGIPPQELHDALKAQGWHAIDETENMWLMVDGKDPKSEPVPIPKHGDTVDPEVMDSVCHRAPGLMGAVSRHVAKKVPSVPPPKP